MREILFSKYSMERSPQFAIRTSIVQDEAHKWVEKTPVTQEAIAHVEKLASSHNALCRIYEGTRVRPCPLTVENGVAKFEFLKGESFHEKLGGLIAEKDEEGILALCREYVSIIKSGAGVEKFRKTPEFVHVFGDIDLPDNLTAIPFSNIDWIFENLIVADNDDIGLIDYEWCFDFPVPLEYILYRSLYHSFSRWGMSDFVNQTLCPKIGISQDLTSALWQTEIEFARYVAQGEYPDTAWYEYSPIRQRSNNWQGEIEQNRQEWERQKQELVNQYEEATQQLIRQHEKAEQQLIRQHEKAEQQLIRQHEEAEQQLIHQQEELKQQLLQVQDAYNAISSAFFWRITKPSRILFNSIKKTKVGWILYKTIHSFISYGCLTTFKKIRTYFLSHTKIDSNLQVRKQTLVAMASAIKQRGGKVFGCFTINENKRPVLLISHELNLTGAPVALEYLAEALKRLDYMPVVISRNDGALRHRFLDNDIPVLVYEQVYQSNIVPMEADLFAFIVVCTNVGAPLISYLNGTKVPVIWWIHEAHISYSPEILNTMPEMLDDNIHVFCGGLYAEKVLKQYRPNYQVKQLLYYVPDYAKEFSNKNRDNHSLEAQKTVFAIVGMQEERKGQDILAQAIQILPLELLRTCLFVFVGRTHYKPIQNTISALCNDFPQNVQSINELNRNELLSFYQKIDCLICASRDDPMPIVVTEAMLLSKIIICSENAGSADILEQWNAGIIYRNNNPKQLAQCIKYVCQHNNPQLLSMREQARRAYEHYFSQDVFDNAVKKIADDLVAKEQSTQQFEGTISVVIPTYNAGSGLKQLIYFLRNQENVKDIEIIVVDSGSSDETVELAEQAGAMVIRITQNEFSHSYARNLGASYAKGEYLLFMTQDALPNGTTWIHSLLQPVLRGDAIAVSCREKPKLECDLFGRMSIWLHSEYMGVLFSDRIMRLPSHSDYDSLRKNGQLNDVTCLIQRDIFKDFQYRGDYAEDLDLGIRLIQNGYQLALLSKVQTVHSHTRPAFYYFKRCLVESKMLKSILSDFPVEKVTESTVINRLVTAYCADVLYLHMLTKRIEVNESLQDFCDWTERQYRIIMGQLREKNYADIKSLIQEDIPYLDENLQEFVLTILGKNKENTEIDFFIANNQSNYITHTIPRFLKANGEVFGPDLKKEICEMVLKHFGQQAGSLLADYCMVHKDDNSMLNKLEIQYSTGI